MIQILTHFNIFHVTDRNLVHVINSSWAPCPLLTWGALRLSVHSVAASRSTAWNSSLEKNVSSLSIAVNNNNNIDWHFFFFLQVLGFQNSKRCTRSFSVRNPCLSVQANQRCPAPAKGILLGGGLSQPQHCPAFFNCPWSLFFWIFAEAGQQLEAWPAIGLRIGRRPGYRFHLMQMCFTWMPGKWTAKRASSFFTIAGGEAHHPATAINLRNSWQAYSRGSKS